LLWGGEIVITDGPKDGGIDAIVERGNSIYIVQSKFNDAIFSGREPTPLPISFYNDFDKLPEFFKDEDGFRDYIKTVDLSFHRKYGQLFNSIRQKNKDIIWWLITLHGGSKSGEGRLRNIDAENFQYYDKILANFEVSLEVVGTPLPLKLLKLHFSESFTTPDHKRNINTYILQGRVDDFIKYIKDDVEFSILARNVRADLRSKINEDIGHTYDTSPDEFWYSHNGITIVCDDASVKGKEIVISQPSIINGAQTIHALKNAHHFNPDANVLVRVIVLPTASKDAKNLLNKIIFRTNQQNKMYKYNLRANDSMQVLLGQEFIKKYVFYERRSGEWDLNKLKYGNFSHLKSTQLAQILMACQERWHSESGVGLARKNIEDLFEDEIYKYLFDEDFSKIYFKYRLYKFVEEVLKYNRKKLEKRQKRVALLTCLAIFWKVVQHCNHSEKWISRLGETPGKMNYKDKFTELLKRSVVEIFDYCWHFWKKELKKDRDLNIHDFFKSSSWNLKMLDNYPKKINRRVEVAFNRLFE